jgi:hypothetical protein
MPGFPEYVPERDGRRGVLEALDPELRDALLDLRVAAAGRGESREVAFHVGEEYGNADRAEFLREALKGHRLAGARGPGDEPWRFPIAGSNPKSDFDFATASGASTFSLWRMAGGEC